MAIKTIFEALGLEVRSIQSGVYHFRRIDAKGLPTGEEVIGIFLVENPLTTETKYVKFFTQDVVPGVPAARIIYHWQTLDARRLEESGLIPLEFDLTVEQIPDSVVEQSFTRPDGARLRHTVKLRSGEVLCYN